MTATKTKSVNMTFPALYSYVLNTNYRSANGVIGIVLSLIFAVLAVVCWDRLASGYRTLCLLLALTFTVINPVVLAWKTFKQLKLSPSYKTPLIYTFTDDGITISQGELSQELPWDKIYKLLLTNSMFAIYTSRMHAFVIPLSELGEEKGKLIASVVQFSATYRPLVSKSLKRYQSGKGL